MSPNKNDLCNTPMFFGTNGRTGPCPMPLEVWCAKEGRGLCGLHAEGHLRQKRCTPSDHSASPA